MYNVMKVTVYQVAVCVVATNTQKYGASGCDVPGTWG